MSRGRPLCLSCKHYHEGEICDAYPEGIPAAIYWTSHFYPKPNDNGIQFELKDGEILPEQQTQAEEDEYYQNYLEEEKYCEENGILIVV